MDKDSLTKKLINEPMEAGRDFRQFIFAPNLLTFVISLVLGNSFGAAVKDFVATFSATVNLLVTWSTKSPHSLKWELLTQPLNNLMGSLSTLALTAIAVYWVIHFINTKIIPNPDERWGFNQSHADMEDLKEQLAKSNEIQEKMLKKLEKQ